MCAPTVRVVSPRPAERGSSPLWGHDTADLAHEFVVAGSRRRSSASIRARSTSLLRAPATTSGCSLSFRRASTCGENGEFHTFVSAGPLFAEPIACERGEIVEREDLSSAT